MGSIVVRIHRAQAQALEIEAGAKRRLADEYDAAQDRGDAQKVGGDRKSIISKQNNAPKVSDLGLTRKQIHEAREIRDSKLGRSQSERPKPATADLGLTPRQMRKRGLRDADPFLTAAALWRR